MYKKYGTEWANKEEYKQWLRDEILLIIDNVEYIYSIKDDKRLAIKLACQWGGYGRTQLTKKDYEYIKKYI